MPYPSKHWAVGATPKGKTKSRSPGDSADVFEGGSSLFFLNALSGGIIGGYFQMVQPFPVASGLEFVGSDLFFVFFCVAWGAWKP